MFIVLSDEKPLTFTSQTPTKFPNSKSILGIIFYFSELQTPGNGFHFSSPKFPMNCTGAWIIEGSRRGDSMNISTNCQHRKTELKFPSGLLLDKIVTILNQSFRSQMDENTNLEQNIRMTISVTEHHLDEPRMERMALLTEKDDH